jgi:PTH1 family peptidyl-tRNA hydrolase
MWLVVGLGNPGAKYAGTRHNVGFMIVDRLAENCGAGPFREKFSGAFVRLSSPDVVLLKPQTFMNLSGESVQSAMTFFKVSLPQVLVVHDELDLAFGDTRLKKGGGTAGHNGLKSILQHGGGDGFWRMRVGIGRPRSGEAAAHVLNDFSASERAELPDVLDHAALGLRAVFERGAEAVMNDFNARPKKPGTPPTK